MLSRPMFPAQHFTSHHDLFPTTGWSAYDQFTVFHPRLFHGSASPLVRLSHLCRSMEDLAVCREAWLLTSDSLARCINVRRPRFWQIAWDILRQRCMTVVSLPSMLVLQEEGLLAASGICFGLNTLPQVQRLPLWWQQIEFVA